MGIFNTIGGWFASGWRDLTGAANTVFNGIKAVYNFITGVFANVGKAWKFVYDGLGALGGDIVSFASHTAAGIAHIVEYTIPHAIEAGGAAVVHGISGTAKALVDAAEAAITAAWKAAVHVVSEAIDAIGKELSPLIKPIKAALDWIENTAKKAVALLENPETLVAWIGNAIVVPVVEGIVSGGEAIAKTLWQWLLGNAHTIFEEIEQMIADII